MVGRLRRDGGRGKTGARAGEREGRGEGGQGIRKPRNGIFEKRRTRNAENERKED